MTLCRDLASLAGESAQRGYLRLCTARASGEVLWFCRRSPDLTLCGRTSIRAEELVAVGLRFNPPPGWPPIPEGFTPQPGWEPDPSWPPPPPGWQLWVSDDPAPSDTTPIQAVPADQPGVPPLPSHGIGGSYGAMGASNGSSPNGSGTAGVPYAPYTPYEVQAEPPGSGRMSGWAVASFALGLLPVFIVNAIFALVALRRIKRLGQRGRGFAIAGLALSGLWIILAILAVVGANTSTATRSSATGVITHRGRMNVFSLKIGDCFDNPAGAKTVHTVTAIPCDQPHNAQIYGKFKLSGSDLSYPGAAAVAQLARSGCNARTGSVNKSLTSSAMSIRIFLPTQVAWITGQRTVNCMIVNPKADLTSSLLNSSPATG
jgi:hypothetical protein